MALEVVELLTTLKADISAFSSGMDAAGKKSQGLVDTIKQHAVAIGAAMTGLGGTLEHFADPMETSRATLETVLTNAGSSFDELKGKIDAVDAHMETFGHTQADTEQALATLTTKLGDPTKALNDMGLVAELAATKHISLNEAAGQLGKIIDGNARTLKQFGITVVNTTKMQSDYDTAQKAVTTSAKDLETATQKLADLKAIDSAKAKLTVKDQIALRDAQQAVTDATTKHDDAVKTAQGDQEALTQATANAKDPLTQLGDKLNGIAEAQANTFGGKMDALKVKVEDFAGSLGAKVGPALVTLGPALSGIGGILSSGVIPKVGEAIKSFVEFAAEHTVEAATFIGENVAMAAAATAAFVAENAATLGIGTAIAALVAGIVWVATHWKESWDAITGAVEAAVGFIRDHWQLIVDVIAGPVGIVVTQVIAHFDTIKGAVTGVYNWVTGTFQNMINWIAGVPGALARTGGHMFDFIINAFKGAWDWIANNWNSLGFTLPEISLGPVHFGGYHIDLPPLPTFALGGTVPGAIGAPQLAMVHGGEEITPWRAGGPQGGSSGGSGPVTIQLVVDGQVLTEVVHNGLLQKQRRTGNLGIEAA